MSLWEFFGGWQHQARAVDDGGRWLVWTQAQPALTPVGSACALGEVVTDRAQQARANELLLALVRVGSADGGVDQSAATFVASLLVPGGDRIIRSLSSLGPDVDAIVAGQLWLQVREYPWRSRPWAVAKNALMETRRAVLADYGASTARRAALIPLPPPQLTQVLDQHCVDGVAGHVVGDLALLQLLAWAQAHRVLAPKDATLLWDLVVAACDEQQSTVPVSRARGVSSQLAGVAVAAARGVTPRTVRRQRDRAVGRLRLARNDFAAGDHGRVHPRGGAVLTGTAPTCREATA